MKYRIHTKLKHDSELSNFFHKCFKKLKQVSISDYDIHIGNVYWFTNKICTLQLAIVWMTDLF